VIVTIAVVTALPVALLVLHASARGAVTRALTLGGAVDLIVGSPLPGGLDTEALRTARATEGVAVAAPVLRERVRVGGHDIWLYGSNLWLRDLGGSLGAAFDERFDGYVDDPSRLFHGVFLGLEAAAQVGVPVGGRLSLRTPDGTTTATELLDVVPGVDLHGERFAFGLLAHTQALVGRDGYDLLLVRARPGVGFGELHSRLSRALAADVVITSPAQQAARATQTLDGIARLLVFVAALVVASGMFLLRGAATLTVTGRLGELATQRALGADRRALLGRFGVEFALLGVVAAPLGVLSGWAVGRAVVADLPWSLVGEAVTEAPAVLPVAAWVIALVLGPLVAVSAALAVLRRALRQAPAAMLRPPPATGLGEPLPGVEGRLAAAAAAATVAGLGLAAGGQAVLDALPPGLVSVLVVGGTIGLTRATRGPLARASTHLLGRGRAAPTLAATGLLRSADRTWASLTVVALGVAIIVAVGGITADLERSVERVLAPVAGVELYVEASPVHRPATAASLPTGLATRVSSLPQVARVTEVTRAGVAAGDGVLELVGVGGPSAHPVFAAARRSDQEAVLAGRRTVLNPDAAALLDVGEGDVVRLPGLPAGGSAGLSVGALVSAPMLASDGVAVVPLDTARSATGGRGPSVLEVVLVPYAGAAEARAELAALVGGAGEVRTGREVLEALSADVSLLTGAVGAVRIVVAVGIAVVLFNLLAATVVERRRELGLLRAVGAPERTVRRAVVLEATAAALVGTVVGVAVGLALQRAAAGTAAELFGLPVASSVDLPAVLAAILVGTGTAAVGAWVAARWVTAAPPLVAVAPR